jgi:hypothetical protein
MGVLPMSYSGMGVPPMSCGGMSCTGSGVWAMSRVLQRRPRSEILIEIENL